MTTPLPRIASRTAARGLTIVELVASAVALFVLLAALAPVLGYGDLTGASMTSRGNLRVLSQAMDCYAADWDDRQFTAVPDDFGVMGGNCTQYANEFGCYPPLYLGWSCGSQIGLWRFPVDCSFGGSGQCSNVPITVPIQFEQAPSPIGVFRIPNVRPVHDYLSGRVHDPVFYAPLDTNLYNAARPYFAQDCEYAGADDLVPPSYVLSPAAMYHPDVLRAPTEGGYRSPGSFDEGFESPAVSQAAHAGLKTRWIEHNWIENPPAAWNPDYSDPIGYFYPNDGRFPFLFNQGLNARPHAAFFDGSVRELPTRRVHRDDLLVRMLTGGLDGLWSRDTPFGKPGYQGSSSSDGTFTSHHILTTGGIRGRDQLSDVSLSSER